VQARLHRRPDLRQVIDRRVGIVEFELRILRGVPDERGVDHEDEHRDDPDRGIAHEFLGPADAEVNRAREDDQRAHHDARGDQRLHPGLLDRLFQALEIGFQSLQVHDVEQGDIGDQRRKEGMFDDVDIGPSISSGQTMPTL